MIGEGKTRGQCAILDIAAANNQNVAAIRVSATPIPPEYVYYVLQERYLESRKESQGGNQPALNAGLVADIVIPIPPLAEISELLSRIAALTAAVNETNVLLESGKAEVSQLKQSVLRSAFDGRLVAQSNTDVPASASLSNLHSKATSRPNRTRKNAGERP